MGLPAGPRAGPAGCRTRGWPALLLALCAGGACTTGAQQPAAVEPVAALGFEALAAIDTQLGAGLERLLAKHLPGASVEPLLAFALPIDTAQFRNTFNITHPATGLQSTRQEFFLLVDAPSPLDTGRSVLRTYETIVAAARCVPGQALQPGCALLDEASAVLQLPKVPVSVYRQGWPDWRPVGAIPENWADDETPWQPLRLAAPPFVIEGEYLYVQLQRGWLSLEFLASDGWYVGGACRGFISDGDPTNDRRPSTVDAPREWLPRLPGGILLTRQLSVREGPREVLRRPAVYLHGWVHLHLPLSPRASDPCRSDCPDVGRHRPLCPADR